MKRKIDAKTSCVHLYRKYILVHMFAYFIKVLRFGRIEQFLQETIFVKGSLLRLPSLEICWVAARSNPGGDIFSKPVALSNRV